MGDKKTLAGNSFTYEYFLSSFSLPEAASGHLGNKARPQEAEERSKQTDLSF